MTLRMPYRASEGMIVVGVGRARSAKSKSAAAARTARTPMCAATGTTATRTGRGRQPGQLCPRGLWARPSNRRLGSASSSSAAPAARSPRSWRAPASASPRSMSIPTPSTSRAAYFGLAPEVDCHVDDARAFLERTAASFDVIVVDSFFENALPRHLCSTEFFRLARSRLTPGGILLFNAVVAHAIRPIVDRLAAGDGGGGARHAHPRHVRRARPQRDRARRPGRLRLRRPTLLVVPSDAVADALAAELDAMAFRDRRPASPIRDRD